MGTKRAIRNAFYRLGMHTSPKAVVHALSEEGVQVTEELVRQVRFEMLKESNRGRDIGGPSKPVGSSSVRRRPQAFPGRGQVR